MSVLNIFSGGKTQPSAATAPAAGIDYAALDEILKKELTPKVREIDEGAYAEETMRRFAETGLYAQHIGGRDSACDLNDVVKGMGKVAEVCLSTAFCVWCQDTLGWYIASSDNEFLKQEVLPKVAAGETLGGTGMSNPMKAMTGIEPMRLKGKKVPGGYEIKGVLPWVSNLIETGYFGMMFDIEEGGETRRAMAIAHAAWDNIKLKLDHDFVAMGGTATCQAQFHNVFLPDEYLLADPADAFIRRIRGGFTLLQCGMATGLIQNCIDLMKQVQPQLGHVNKYLEKQPEDFEEALAGAAATLEALCKTPYDESNAFYRKTVELRLAGGELAVEAAHYAMLHCGARGYVTLGAAQRRLREAYFIAIVTPATKHLRKLLAEMPAAA